MANAVTPDTNNSYIVQCRDLPELNSVGYSIEKALKEAVDGIETVLMIYIDEYRSMPVPSPVQEDEYLVALPVETVEKIKIKLHNQMLWLDK